MNRRAFFATIFAAPLAAVAALRTKPSFADAWRIDAAPPVGATWTNVGDPAAEQVREESFVSWDARFREDVFKPRMWLVYGAVATGSFVE